ncbi:MULTISPECIES: DUF4148 domain-containing protein [Burkholderia cepacia complex]|uniref:DUF4148 domain-containing protein n=1 Tax=Burkholderia cepacia complex TaxID=87882 RepID=UPI00064C159A|nr:MULTISPECIES: DUF4148 domain-containing protein [Burkholderia cepacia complex]AKM05123.1 hypothetical protein ABD05_33570 [Burkholderia pyrrocinia]GAU06495.1 PF13663 domain protein [Burkholderia stabilis]
MKLVAAFVVATLSLPFGTQAFARSTQAPITRADVRQQLIDAEADGLLPSNRNDYPPSASQIARNRQLHAIQHHDTMPTATASTGN